MKQAEKHLMYCNELKVENNNANNVQREQVIAVSDLHGNMEKWKTIKNMMQSNPNMKLFILGDATDRGRHGIEILLEIKELCDQGRAEYLPGNHDIFLYNYVRIYEFLNKLEYNQRIKQQDLIDIVKREARNLMGNGGEETLKKLEKFDRIVSQEISRGNIKQKIKKIDLINWLGGQPIQKKIKVNNTKYALAHACFDEDLYNYDNKFNLKKALMFEALKDTDNVMYKKFKTVMWYREKATDTHYAPVTFPKGSIVLAGHTVQDRIKLSYFQKDLKQPMVIIDTGTNNNEAWDLTNGKVFELKNKYRENEEEKS